MKKSHLILFFILVFAFILRVKFLDFPAIQGVKEAEYLSIAKGFNETGDFINKRVYFFSAFTEKGLFELYPQMPILSFWAYLVFVLFGEKIWIIRLFPVLCSIGSIILTFLIIKKLADTQLALIASFLITITPLSVYFGRMIMPESPSLFFYMLSVYLFLKWTDTFERKRLIFSMLAFSLSTIFKYSIAPFGIAFLFIIPYNKHKINPKDILTIIICLLPILIVFTAYQLTQTGEIQDEKKLFENIYAFEALNPFFWIANKNTFYIYIKTGFSIISIFFILGMIFALRKNHPMFKLTIGLLVSTIPYLLLTGSVYLKNNIYYFYPLIFLTTIGASIFLQKIKTNHKYLFLIILILTVHLSSTSTNALFNDIVPGSEIVGKYIKENTLPEQRIFVYGGSEAFPLCYYAERKCGNLPENTETFKNITEKFDVPFIYILRPSRLEKTELINEINKKYSIKQKGRIITNENNKPVHVLIYHLLKKDFKQDLEMKIITKEKTYHKYNALGFKKKDADFYTETYN